MLSQKKTRFGDSPALTVDVNNGFKNEEKTSDNAVNETSNQLSQTEVQQMMAEVRKQIEERKRKLNVFNTHLFFRFNSF